MKAGLKRELTKHEQYEEKSVRKSATASRAGGTFHSFGNLILRKYASVLDLSPNFAIFDRVDAESPISMLRKELSRKTQNRSLPRKHTLANSSAGP